jgi:hypothetical protein
VDLGVEALRAFFQAFKNITHTEHLLRWFATSERQKFRRATQRLCTQKPE